MSDHLNELGDNWKRVRLALLALFVAHLVVVGRLEERLSNKTSQIPLNKLTVLRGEGISRAGALPLAGLFSWSW